MLDLVENLTLYPYKIQHNLINAPMKLKVKLFNVLISKIYTIHSWFIGIYFGKKTEGLYGVSV